jgi:hypothetical protein
MLSGSQLRISQYWMPAARTEDPMRSAFLLKSIEFRHGARAEIGARILRWFLLPFQAIGVAIFRSRQRRVELAIAAHLERSGGRLTDDLERRIAQGQRGSNLSPPY